MKKIILVPFLVFLGWQTTVFAADPVGGGPILPPPPSGTVPEPSILWLMVGGIVSLGIVRFLKNKK